MITLRLAAFASSLLLLANAKHVFDQVVEEPLDHAGHPAVIKDTRYRIPLPLTVQGGGIINIGDIIGGLGLNNVGDLFRWRIFLVGAGPYTFGRMLMVLPGGHRCSPCR